MNFEPNDKKNPRDQMSPGVKLGMWFGIAVGILLAKMIAATLDPQHSESATLNPQHSESGGWTAVLLTGGVIGGLVGYLLGIFFLPQSDSKDKDAA